MTLFDDIQNEIDLGIEDIGVQTEGYHHIMKASEMIDELREEYAPTVEMKPYQFEVFKKYRYGVRKGDIDFGGIWSDKPYRMMEYFKEESYTGTTIWDENFAKAWLHPETIKVVDE